LKIRDRRRISSPKSLIFDHVCERVRYRALPEPSVKYRGLEERTRRVRMVCELLTFRIEQSAAERPDNADEKQCYRCETS
jgi:hypothetical protein